jgi:hypothetical protein
MPKLTSPTLDLVAGPGVGALSVPLPAKIDRVAVAELAAWAETPDAEAADVTPAPTRRPPDANSPKATAPTRWARLDVGL